jgi:hypothetical protein
MKCMRSACGVAVVRGKAFVIGGCASTGELASYEVLNLVTHQWVTDEPLPMPFGVCEHAVAVHHETIYVVGGCRGRFTPDEAATNEVAVFRCDTNEWGNLPPMPAPRRLATAVATSLREDGRPGASASTTWSASDGLGTALLLVLGGFDRVNSNSLQTGIFCARVAGMSYSAKQSVWTKVSAGMLALAATARDCDSSLVVLGRCQNNRAGDLAVVATPLDLWRRGLDDGAGGVLWRNLCTVSGDEDSCHCVLLVS